METRKIKYRLFSSIFHELKKDHPLIQLQDAMISIPRWRLEKDFGGEMWIALKNLVNTNVSAGRCDKGRLQDVKGDENDRNKHRT